MSRFFYSMSRFSCYVPVFPPLCPGFPLPVFPMSRFSYAMSRFSYAPVFPPSRIVPLCPGFPMSRFFPPFLSRFFPPMSRFFPLFFPRFFLYVPVFPSMSRFFLCPLCLGRLDFIRNKVFRANPPGFPGQIPYF